MLPNNVVDNAVLLCASATTTCRLGGLNDVGNVFDQLQADVCAQGCCHWHWYINWFATLVLPMLGEPLRY